MPWPACTGLRFPNVSFESTMYLENTPYLWYFAFESIGIDLVYTLNAYKYTFVANFFEFLSWIFYCSFINFVPEYIIECLALCQVYFWE